MNHLKKEANHGMVVFRQDAGGYYPERVRAIARQVKGSKGPALQSGWFGGEWKS